MKRRLLLIGILFFVGFGLSGILFRYGIVDSVHANVKPTAKALLKERLRYPEGEKEISVPDLVKASLSPKTRRTVLTEALKSGELSEIQVVRSDYLSAFDDYKESILPIIKESALNELLARFVESDWRNWPEASIARRGKPSGARVYLDNILAVNAELGVFLETSAQLFHELSKETAAARVYNAHKAFERIELNAEKLLRFKKDSSLSLKFFFSNAVLSDPIFENKLEAVRCEFIGRSLDSQQDRAEEQLHLISSVKPKACPEAFYPSLSGYLERLSLRGSQKLRVLFFTSIDAERKAREASKISNDVAVALAQLYTVGAVDSLERGVPEDAEIFLEDSIKLVPGLKGQALVGAFLAGVLEMPFAEPKKGDVLSDIPNSKKSTEKKPAKKSTSAKAEEGSGFLNILLIIISVVGLLILSRVIFRFFKVYSQRSNPDYYNIDEFWESDTTEAGNL